MTTPILYTPETLAERWGCTPRNIKDKIKENKLGCFKLGRRYKIPQKEVDMYENGERLENKQCTTTTTTKKTSDSSDSEVSIAPITAAMDDRYAAALARGIYR